MQSGSLDVKFVPVRMMFEQRTEDLIQDLAALIERIEMNLAAGRDDLKRRRYGRHVPARITFRVFVARAKINAAIPVQLMQQAFQSFMKRNSGLGAGYGDSARRSISQLGHKEDCGR
jgi:hypothetical protein